jgi:hypothetical protein
LRKTLGLHFGNEGMGIQPRYYTSRAFVASFDLERVLGASFTGQNTMDGQMMTIRMQAANTSTVTLPTNNTCSLYYTLVYDALLQINLSGVQVLE